MNRIGVMLLAAVRIYMSSEYFKYIVCNADELSELLTFIIQSFRRCRPGALRVLSKSVNREKPSLVRPLPASTFGCKSVTKMLSARIDSASSRRKFSDGKGSRALTVTRPSSKAKYVDCNWTKSAPNAEHSCGELKSSFDARNE